MNLKIYSAIISLLFLFSCGNSGIEAGEKLSTTPEIFPDYAGCTIPPNIAPLNFRLSEPYEKARAALTCGEDSWKIGAGKKQFTFAPAQWKKIMKKAQGKSIEITVHVFSNGSWKAYRPFQIHVANDSIDPYIAYRLIEPGYQLWNQMGIYQRNLENYRQTPIIENTLTGNNCVNCHSFCDRDPDNMLFHMRHKYGGTIMVADGKMEKLNTKTEQTISNLVYPSWHHSGNLIAFSLNDTNMACHMNDANRMEYYDNKSDIVIYDVDKHEIFTTELLFADDWLETFPGFSPDGKTIYFCTAKAKKYPDDFEDIKYSLCKISFDAETRTFGTTVDTLYNATTQGRSVSYPRVSPDGKYLLYTLADYGSFSLWHKDADLYMIDLATNEHYPLDAANCDSDADSYHSWSSNSRWVVFGSRRMDRLYGRPFITYINDEGKAEKPFMLPQKNAGYYDLFMKSYSIPEFISAPVKNRQNEIRRKARHDSGTKVTFKGF